MNVRRVIQCAVLIWLTASGAIASDTADPWKFGVMSDTQWKTAGDADNPDSVAVGIIRQINRRFIEAGVRFVIQVGDLTDNGSAAALQTRAAAAEELYEAGIGFFPLRGNHEPSREAARQFQTLYPQTQNRGGHLFGTVISGSPFPALRGLSYCFDYRNVRCILLDQFSGSDGPDERNDPDHNIVDQMDWIKSCLADRPAKTHALVFSHKELIGQNHADTLFGADPAGNPAAQNDFIEALHTAGVRYLIAGHDHMHHRSLITAPDGTAAVQQLITASNSYKFYTPKIPANDETYNHPCRETPLAQELYTIGYYLFTVDGPQLTVEYYSSATGFGDIDVTLHDTPALHFTKRETFGYSLDGKEFLIRPGEPYATVQDSRDGIRAAILSGGNTGHTVDFSGRPLATYITTAWKTPLPARKNWIKKLFNTVTAPDNSDEPVFTLRGMAYPGNDGRTDEYTLSLGYRAGATAQKLIEQGAFGLATPGENGKWINAADKTAHGAGRFVRGPWEPGYPPGTYGVDEHRRTVWAVLDFSGDFAARPFAVIRTP